MLSHTKPRRYSAHQHGVVLIMALIVLVAMTLAALALTRSVYTSNYIAGNIASQQTTTYSADAGIEAATSWLETNNGVTAATSTCTGVTTVLACDQKANGYFASKQNLTGTQSWPDFWRDAIQSSGYVVSLPTDSAGNTVSYIIDRLCSRQLEATDLSNDCSQSPVPSAGSCAGGGSCDAGKTNITPPSQIYYRITVQVTGPRNTQSFVQSIVAM